MPTVWSRSVFNGVAYSLINSLVVFVIQSPSQADVDRGNSTTARNVGKKTRELNKRMGEMEKIEDVF